MHVLRGLQRPAGLNRPLFLAVGNFDGVHVGHQAIMRALVSEAAREGASPGAMTFDPHVRRVLEPDRPLPLLTSLADRAALLAGLGVEWLWVVPFDRRLAAMEAEAFARGVLVEGLGVRRVFVGEAFRFGRGGLGDAETLARAGLEVRALPAVQRRGRRVSSTAVRELLAAGDVAAAAELLGRPHVVEGLVVPGAGRGRGLGFPTANVEVREDGTMLPAGGVYAVEACAPGSGRAPGVANLGVRPTFGDVGRPVLEVHLLDRDCDLAGRVVRVAFVARLRDERRFPSAEALVRQLRQDVEHARQVLAAAPPLSLPPEAWQRYLCAGARVYAPLGV